MKIVVVIIIIIIIMTLYYMYNTREYFDNNERSTSSEVGEGSSEYWGWGFDGIKEKHHKKERKCPKCDHVYIDNDVCNIIIDDRHKCRNCDITKNKDIDKYVLKSSVPPCPDMSNYATKSMIQGCPNMNNYVLKSKLPEYCAAYRPDWDKYMLKSECIPHSDKYVEVYKDIRKHPEYNKYISKDNCKKYKHSWIQDFNEWWESIFGNGMPKPTAQEAQRFPTGYSFSPYAGYGTDNPGYNLNGL